MMAVWNSLASGSFDGEGTATQRTVLVENGMLKQYLYDCLSAKKAGTVSTGNGVRGSYKGTPHVGTTNYYLAAGRYSPEQLIGSVEQGIYVTEILGCPYCQSDFWRFFFRRFRHFD